MIVPLWLDRIPEVFGGLAANAIRWDPIGTSVSIRIEDSGDPYLIGRTITGAIRACGRGRDFRWRELLLVYLDEELHYRGHFVSEAIDLVVLTPALRWHTSKRLLLTWSAVRLIDAPSFRDEDYGRSIGTGRLSKT